MTRAATAIKPYEGDQPHVRFLVALTLCVIVFQAIFSVGDLILSPARLLYLVVVPFLLIRLLAGSYGRITAIDILIFCHLFWLVITVFVNHPVGVAVTYTGSNVILILGGYLVGRVAVRSIAEMRGAMLFLIFLVLFSLPFAAVEARTSNMVLARLIDLLPGLRGNIDVNYGERLGLYRVQFLFAHPIHFGLFCSCAFAFCFIGLRNYLGVMTRLLTSAGIAVATFLSVASGPFLSLGVQIFLIIWGTMFTRVRYRWRLLAGIAFLIYLILEVLSTRPAIYVIVSRLAFSASTANDRRILFEYGVAQVYRDPILGVGFNPWPLPHFMTGSIDNHWLLLSIVFGLPTFLFIIGALFLMFYRIGKVRDTSSAFNDMRLAWNITMISLMLTLATVAIWTEMLSLFYFIIGSGVWMTTYRPDTTSSSLPTQISDRKARNVYSRFPVRSHPDGSTLTLKDTSR